MAGGTGAPQSYRRGVMERNNQTGEQMRQYVTENKSEWPDGPWQGEPDKVQWVDEPTNLDCLIVRGPAGALCGYVGVPESHPWYGKDYGQCAQSPACEDSWCSHSPESLINVHGGLTFADSCREATRENWEHWRSSMIARKKEAVEFPRGDMAEAWRERGHMVTDYDQWREYGEAAFICHVAEPGRPEKVWWFGFDCAHAGDVMPKYDPETRRIFPSAGYEYRDMAYVRGECARLAEQLAAISA